jgi:hypothetical protein
VDAIGVVALDPRRPPAVLAPPGQPGPLHLSAVATVEVVLPGHDEVRSVVEDTDTLDVELAETVALADVYVL